MRDREASAGFRVFAIATALITIGIAVSLRYDPEKPTKIVALFLGLCVVLLIGFVVEHYLRGRGGG